jgi:hypothetical protein
MKNKYYHYFIIPHETLDDIKFKKLSASTRLIYVYLTKLSNTYQDKKTKDLWFFRSIDNLIEDIVLFEKPISSIKLSILLKNHKSFVFLS